MQTRQSPFLCLVQRPKNAALLGLGFAGLYALTVALVGTNGMTLPMFLVVPLVLLISVVDAMTYRIPDVCNLGVAVLGAWHIAGQAELGLHVSAALCVGAVLWGLSAWYYRRFGRTGLGLGDVKFIAAATVWVGPLGLPYMLLIASSAGIVVALVGRKRLMGDGGQIAVPFGPFLAFGFFVVLVTG
ncbi:A24 family peptidase [Ascidiaceihabitans sp.]|uniref:prepilin peptidase n=1 Tax=Ascidiaceihabitans sp. TaxID=1872644 RepID=UPI0032987100